MRFSMDLIYKIYNDDGGESIEVREDCDGLGLIEICSMDHKDGLIERVTLVPGKQTEYAIEALTAINAKLSASEDS